MNSAIDIAMIFFSFQCNHITKPKKKERKQMSERQFSTLFNDCDVHDYRDRARTHFLLTQVRYIAILAVDYERISCYHSHAPTPYTHFKANRRWAKQTKREMRESDQVRLLYRVILWHKSVCDTQNLLISVEQQICDFYFILAIEGLAECQLMRNLDFVKNAIVRKNRDK